MRLPFAKTAAISVALLAALVTGAADARSTDRNQPMDIEADASTFTLGANGTMVANGRVVITQGTLKINATQGVLNQTSGKASRAQLSGGVTMSQQMDDGTIVNTTSSTVDYDFNTEIIILTGNVKITQPTGSLTGGRVVYNMRTGQVQSGGQGSGRVKMRIMPKTN